MQPNADQRIALNRARRPCNVGRPAARPTSLASNPPPPLGLSSSHPPCLWFSFLRVAFSFGLSFPDRTKTTDEEEGSGRGSGSLEPGKPNGPSWMCAAPKGWSGNMVQPGSSDCSMMGDDSSLGRAAAPHLPAELAGHEVIQHFLAENRDLKEAIRQSNHMLRERYREFLQFHTSHKEEKDFLMRKFQEARIVVESLQLERAELRRRLEEAIRELEPLKSQRATFRPSSPEKGTSGAQEEPDTVTLTQEEAILAM
ncbi:PREDICTED: uncharacterized protein LOC107109923, partial [Gekko japonicus]|uniref:Uncharacterized protein LOC107109923 n=1 Tax=Gekko japonicus TaxID=146911 RepID=A0ABM1JXD1_GEKJA